MSEQATDWGTENEATDWLIGGEDWEPSRSVVSDTTLAALQALPAFVEALPSLIESVAAIRANGGDDTYPPALDELWEQLETTLTEENESEVAFIAVAEVLIAASELGLAVFDRVRGSSSFASSTASYIHNPSPRGLAVQTRTFNFPITAHHPRYWQSNPTFWFRVTLEYDGFNVRRASVIQDRDRSSTMSLSSFSIDFTPAAFTASNEPVAAVVYNLSGRWDPFGTGDESFDGRFVLDAAGQIRGLTVSSPQRWVQAGQVTASGGGPVPRPTRAINATSVHFSPAGSFKVEAASVRHLHGWFQGLPPAVQSEIKNGNLSIQLAGRTSTTGGELSNQRLARRARRVCGGGAPRSRQHVSAVHHQLARRARSPHSRPEGDR